QTVVHLGRGPTDAQKVAVLFEQPTCVVEGCNRTRIEYDHTVDWRTTHHTKVGELGAKCHHHHLQKTLYGWDLVEAVGKRPMGPPDDPAPPNNKNKAPP